MYSRSTILVVDDEEIVKKKLKDAMSAEFDIIDASNGKEALELLEAKSGRISVVLLDLIMPVMDGFQFMNEFRKHQEYSNIPVIVATANDDWHSEQKCLEAGVWDFVMKPYNPVLLQFRIRNAIEKSRHNSYRPRCERYSPSVAHWVFEPPYQYRSSARLTLT